MEPTDAVQFTLTADDYVALARRLTVEGRDAAAWTRFRRQRLWLLAGVPVGTALYIAAIVNNFRGMVDPGSVEIALFGGLVAWGWWSLVNAFRGKSREDIDRQLREYAWRDEVRRTLGPTSVTLYPRRSSGTLRPSRWCSLGASSRASRRLNA